MASVNPDDSQAWGGTLDKKRSNQLVYGKYCLLSVTTYTLTVPKIKIITILSMTRLSTQSLFVLVVTRNNRGLFLRLE